MIHGELKNIKKSVLESLEGLYEYKEKERVKKLRCGHLFHANCVDTWLKDNKVCPICKKEAIYR